MEPPQVAIVIPAFNEQDTISRVVREVKTFGEVILVNDCSTDDTRKLAEEAGAILVNHKYNKGYDGALSSGFQLAEKLGFDVVVTFDADGQHNPDLINQYINHIYHGYDAVVGIRNKFQRYSEIAYSYFGRWKWGIVDPLCGMKAYRMDLYRELGHFNSYESIGTELIIFAASEGKKIKQIPIEVAARCDAPRFGKGLIAELRILASLWISVKKY